MNLKKSRDRDVIAARLYWDEDIIRELGSELWFGDVVEKGGDCGGNFCYFVYRHSGLKFNTPVGTDPKIQVRPVISPFSLPGGFGRLTVKC